MCCHVLPLHNAWPAPSLAGSLYSTHTIGELFRTSSNLMFVRPQWKQKAKLKADCKMRDFRLPPRITVDDIFSLLGHYTAYSGNLLSSFRDIFGSKFKGHEILYTC